MVEWLSFSLRAWDRYRGDLPRAEFLDRLTFTPGDPDIAEVRPGFPRVQLLDVAREDFSHVDAAADAGAQTEAFESAVRNGLLKAAEWLARQPADVFEDLRAAGRVTDVFVGGWITDDGQFDLELPPEFLRACGMLGLTVTVCTND